MTAESVTARKEAKLDRLLDVIVDAPISDLKTNEWNPRTISKERMRALIKSLEADPAGIKDRPCIALPDGTVIAGNMRLEAARQLGWETIPCVFHDYDIEKAKIVALRDNGSWGDWEDEALAELLKDLDSRDVDMALTGFGDADLARLLAEMVEDDRGTDLSLMDVSIGDVQHQCEFGDVWRVGEHLLVVEGVYDGWPQWIGHLDDPSMLLVPYPTPTLPLTVRAGDHRLLMVQPDRWLAGHILDKYAAVKGEATVGKVSR